MMLAQLFALDAYGQQRIVTGRVLDNATDENMIGVSVQVKGTATGGITDMDGKFQVNVSSLPYRSIHHHSTSVLHSP